MKEIHEAGLYIVSDDFFKQYPSDRYMDNKGGSRPHYYAIADKSGVLWMIPLSTRVEKYQRLIQAAEKRHGKGNCIHYLIAPIYGKDRVFIICDMFPVLPEHILRPYKIGGCPYILESKGIRKAVRTKAMAYLNMVERGVMSSPLHIMETKEKLLKKTES